MGEISLDLSKQEYLVFDISKNSKLMLKNKNFIFGKNGSGKSTLCELIKSQFNETHNVFIFSGFENILIDNKLGAVVLGKENIQIQTDLLFLDKEIEKLRERKQKQELLLKQLQWIDTYKEDGIEKHELLQKKEDDEHKYKEKKEEIDKFCQEKARILKSKERPQITKPTYNKQDFSNDIPNKCRLNREEIENLEKILIENTKKDVPKFHFPKFDLKNLLEEINNVLQKKVKETIIIEELKDQPTKQAFAREGLRIHKDVDVCSFCGNHITESRKTKLERYFSVSEVEKLEKLIKSFVQKINENLKFLNNINDLDKGLFYEKFYKRVDAANLNINSKKTEYKLFFQQLIEKLEEKEKNLFGTVEIALVKIPECLSTEEDEINSLIADNNNFSKNLYMEQNAAQKSLRLHYVAEYLEQTSTYKDNWLGYENEEKSLNDLEVIKNTAEKILASKISEIKGSPDKKEDTLLFIKDEISEKTHEKNELLKKTKNTSQSAININEKLKNTGKDNLELHLVKDDDKVEHYLIQEGDNYRDIDKISTGEKNIIAFLYFLESLSDLEIEKSKPKIIILDDPMNSNDDTMQYLIITELQKLYQGSKYRDKFNSDKDFFICLTHNAHFYINVQPHGYFKDKKIDKETNKVIEVSKYDKNNFYIIENRNFRKITSEKEDLNTHYEYLWMELEELYNRNLLNSMLNSMRRIIETYMNFNKIEQDSFYNGKEEYMKIFNVNSHSIDDLSAEMIGKTKEDLLAMFKQLFIDNDSENHFNTYWKVTSDQ
ncbi:Wobble nucleotide-excising tRNase [Anaerosphaera aminiphila DSM 21120]|uniref:Wobble nucleotide-excising tRNase n=1 Tax=Anaerosphaera aminiphila DSM 21120 TaxID=1120995 RepID=A0A1M5PM66_9FIRM|nr:AAA family ATPase [Anaerosphaera aminiphila]SHH02649.1 Wobble nucleotide-excising tRNase [Anaerosphaera aminiphila DSM 21120]